MLSEALRVRARELWRKQKDALGPLGPALDAEISSVPGDEGALLALAYGTLPISDAATVSVPVIHSFVRHALFLREHSPFCRGIPEDMFLHFVWYPRVNSEDITDCRPFFYEHLATLTDGLDSEDAVLAINRWCAEHMTYELTDGRTENPLTAYRSGTGRCGEESVFLVTALRSVGIPARQVYVPWWAHCDDNHAWVEAWTGGRWRYLGACEPEPVLDRGWFCDAAARAPLVHYRTFFDCREGDQLTERMGSVRLYNVTGRYADTSRLTVCVTGPDGRTAPGAMVEIDVVNMTAFRPILRSRTDSEGCFTVDLGRSGLHVEVFYGELTASADVQLASDTEVTLTLAPPRADTFICELAPPAPSARNRTSLSPAQQEENAAILAACAAARMARAETWRRPEYDTAEGPWPKLFALAAGNAPELYRFCLAHEGRERSLAAQMLLAMAEKDCRDVTFEVLEGHFQAALPYAASEHFVEEILDPRIGYEVLENWRHAILAALPEQDRRRFAACPETLMARLAALPEPEGNYYPTLAMTPSAVLAAGRADERARRALFVAVMRTLGVPARLDPADGAAEYWRDGRYHRADDASADSCTVRLLPQADERSVYGTDWTLSRREDDGWTVLEDGGWTAPFRLSLRPGLYRLVTAHRLPNGRQLCCVTGFMLERGWTAALPLVLESAAPEDMLSRIPLEPVRLRAENGSAVSTGSLFSGPGVMMWLRPGTEPTAHVLGELMDAAPALAEQGLGLAAVFLNRSDTEDAAVRRMLAALPGTAVLFDESGRAGEHMARELFLEPGVWPLLALVDGAHTGRFGCAGYQAGAVELISRLATCL